MSKQRDWLLSKKWGYAASVALVPYAILKTLWANGLAFMVSGKGIEELHASIRANADPVSKWLYANGIDTTAVLALIASLLALALVRERGRKLPRRLLLASAFLGGSFLIIICFANFYKLFAGDIRLSDAAEFDPLVLPVVYGGFFAWGITISMAALSFGVRTRELPVRSSPGRWKRWPEWARRAALGWTAIYGALGVYWSLGGSGFPFGLSNDPQAQSLLFKHAAAATGGPVIAMLCMIGVIALYLFKFRMNGVARTILLAYAWAFSTILCFLVLDARPLIIAAYAPVSLIGALFGRPVPFFDALTWPVVNQFICLAGGLLWAAAALSFQRYTSGACLYCGRRSGAGHWMASSSGVRWGRRAAYCAIIAPLYYDITRIAWLLGFPLGISDEMLRDLQETGADAIGAGLALVSIGGAFLTRGLIKPWGETFPRRFPLLAGKRVPPAMAIVPAGLVSILLIVTGIQVFAGFWAIGDFRNWGATTPLLLMPVWGVALGIATVFYYCRRQGKCERCGFLPASGIAATSGDASAL
ncbi:hypothetical protein ACFSL6_08285 [Paenibacillus thailandensis]|uniref:Uncharacterized protein n=1 Tax=Paenibacillus thailandensis TaxID=393250 RepID=A0ABW5QVT2_9BACL